MLVAFFVLEVQSFGIRATSKRQTTAAEDSLGQWSRLQQLVLRSIHGSPSLGIFHACVFRTQQQQQRERGDTHTSSLPPDSIISTEYVDYTANVDGCVLSVTLSTLAR